MITYPNTDFTCHIRLSADPPRVELADGQVLAASGWPIPENDTDVSGKIWRWLVGPCALSLMSIWLPDRSGLILRVAVRNIGAEPLRIRALAPWAAATITRAADGGKAGDWMITNLGTADGPRVRWNEEIPSANDQERKKWAGYAMPVPFTLPKGRAEDPRWRSFIDSLVLARDGGDGFLLQAGGPGRVELGIDAEFHEDAIRLEVAAFFGNSELAPGADLIADDLLLLSGQLPGIDDEAMRWVASTHGSRIRPTPMAWCSWYDRFGEITETHINAVAGALAAARPTVAIDVMQVDDGWQRQVGDWRTNEKFPGGLAGMVAGTRASGAAAGIWLAPLAVHESTALFNEHPDWLQRDVAGEPVGRADNWGPLSRWLDPTHPGVQAFLRHLLARLRSDGFTYFKIDFNFMGSNTRWHDCRATRMSAFRDLYKLYREAIGEDAYLLCCGTWSLRAPAGFADAVRIGPDSIAVWDSSNPCCIRDCVRALSTNVAPHGILYCVDPDVTYVRPRHKLTDPEFLAWHGFVGLLGGLIGISEPMHRPEYVDRIEYLEMLLPPLSDRGHAFDGPVDERCRRFGFHAKRPFGEFAVVQLHNPSADVAADVDIDLSRFGLKQAHAWSFWDDSYLGIVSDRMIARALPPHGARIIRLTAPDSRRPIIVGSNLHIGCGAAEIAAVSYDDDAIMVCFAANAGRRTGVIHIVSPWPLQIAKVVGMAVEMSQGTDGLHTFKLDRRSYQGIQTLTLLPDGRADVGSGKSASVLSGAEPLTSARMARFGPTAENKKCVI
jgi:hypothetical protein